MKNVLITGVSSGIGYASVQYLLKQGYKVFGSVRKEADAKRLSKTFDTNFHPLVFDVCDDQAIQHALQKVKSTIGDQGLAGLVNNAGIAVNGPLQHIPIEKIAHQFDVNCLGLIRVTQAFLPFLGASKNSSLPPGKIINISSVAGRFANPFMAPYCASKHAVEAISDSLRRELLIYGIDVVVIQPGPIKSDIWEKVQATKDDYMDTDYAPLLAQIGNMVSQAEKKALPAVTIAKRIHHILTAKRTKTRYIIAHNKLSFSLMQKLVPDRVIDFFLKKEIQKFYKGND